MNQSPFKLILGVIKYRLNLDDDKATQEEVFEIISKGVEFKGANLWTLIFAILIASIGLNVNSTAVIIGAMLISPLMGPIIGIGLGAGIFDFRLIKKAVKNLFIATLIGLSTSSLYFLLSPITQAQSELLARTSPTIWDVLIAFFGGLSGIVASTRKKYNNVIPGVAIATALMPPLCTAGFGLATAQWSYFFGAFYLLLINSVFISIGTFLVVRFLKYKPASYVNPDTSAKVKKWVVTIAVLTILPSLYLAYYFVGNAIFSQNANRFINEEFSSLHYAVLQKDISPEKRTISILFIGEATADSVRQILELKKSKYDLENSIILVNNTSVKSQDQLDISKLKESIIHEAFTKQEEKLKIKEQELQAIKMQYAQLTNFSVKREEAVQEFYSLYGQPKELSIEKTINHTLTSNDTIILVYFKTNSSKFRNEELRRIEGWLKIKFNCENVKIIKD